MNHNNIQSIHVHMWPVTTKNASYTSFRYVDIPHAKLVHISIRTIFVDVLYNVMWQKRYIIAPFLYL